FKPDEVTPEKANQVGLELAKKLAPNHEVAVYTHDDTNHVHNHIVINSVNFETGKKYQAHGKEAKIGRASCREKVIIRVTREDGIRDQNVTGVQTCALPIYSNLTRLHLKKRIMLA